MNVLFFAAGFAAGIAFAAAWRTRSSEPTPKLKETLLIETVADTSAGSIEEIENTERRIRFDIIGEIPDEVRQAMRALIDSWEVYAYK